MGQGPPSKGVFDTDAEVSRTRNKLSMKVDFLAIYISEMHLNLLIYLQLTRTLNFLGFSCTNLGFSCTKLYRIPFKKTFFKGIYLCMLGIMLKTEKKIFCIGNVYFYMHLLRLTLNSGLRFLKLAFAGLVGFRRCFHSTESLRCVLFPEASPVSAVSSPKKHPGVHCLFPETVPVWILWKASSMKLYGSEEFEHKP